MIYFVTNDHVEGRLAGFVWNWLGLKWRGLMCLEFLEQFFWDGGVVMIHGREGDISVYSSIYVKFILCLLCLMSLPSHDAWEFYFYRPSPDFCCLLRSRQAQCTKYTNLHPMSALILGVSLRYACIGWWKWHIKVLTGVNLLSTRDKNYEVFI